MILHIFDKAKGLICIEDNKPEAIAKMQEAVKDEDRIEVKVLKTKYPQGGERTLISAATRTQDLFCKTSGRCRMYCG